MSHVRKNDMDLMQISQIRSYLSEYQAKMLIHAYVTSKLDTNNALLYGVSECVRLKLQLDQNAAATAS